MTTTCPFWTVAARSVLAAVVMCVAFGANARAQTVITIVPDAGLTGNPAALAAVNKAALMWSSRLSDPITITINVKLSTTDSAGIPFVSTVAANQTSVSLQAGYNTIRNQMVTDAVGKPSKAIIASLPTAAQFTAAVPTGRSLSGNLVFTKANAKAVGFTGLDGTFGISDGTIALNSAFAFDLDRSNGVTAGTTDLQSVAAQQIGGVLGFNSVVHDIDTTTAAQLPSVSPTTLDLFRFGRLSSNPGTAIDFTTTTRNLVPGADTITDDITSEYRMSTGVTNGDGRIPAFWKDDALTGVTLGIMDPTIPTAQAFNISGADLRAVELIGYDVVPEPSLLLILAGLVCVAGSGRRRLRA